MDAGDKRSGTKKRSKPLEIGFDADDEQPIGSMFKMRRLRNSKKLSLASEDTTDRGKKDDAIGKTMVATEEDLGSMDDTLATFRKRLKCPKRKQGSGFTSERNSALNVVVESSDMSLNVSLKDWVSDKKTSLCNVNEGNAVGDNGFDLTMDSDIPVSHLGKVEGPNVDLALSHGDLVGGEPRNISKDGNSASLLLGDSLQHSYDELQKGSLSGFSGKDQSNLINKSCTSLSLKQKSSSQIVDDKLSPGFRGVHKTVEFVAESKSRSASASKLVGRNLKSANDLHEASDLCLSTSAFVMDDQKFDNDCLQVEIHEGICDSNVHDEPIADPSLSTNVFNGSPSLQKVALQERIVNDGLKQCSTRLYDVEEMVEAASLPRVGEGACRFSEDEFKRRPTVELAQVCNESREHDVSIPMKEKISLPSCDVKAFNKSSKNVLNENNQLVSGGISCGFNSLDTNAEMQAVVSDFSLEKNVVISDGGSLPVASNNANESELACQSNCSEKPLESSNILNDSIASVRKCDLVLQNQPSDDTFEEGSNPNDNCFVLKKEGDRAYPPSAILEENENCTEYAASRSYFANKDGKISAVQRTVRKAKKCRHGDMAYEGDADWEIFNDQSFFDSQGVVDGEHTLKTGVKLDSSMNVVEESESVAAAVSAGLKAHAASPVEKIRFKEILKRKAGLQEYLDCRNQILSLWSRNVTRILPLSECGVNGTPAEDEHPHSTLIREVYAFLDQCGYINVGIATQKNAGIGAKHSYKLVKEKEFEECSTASMADSEDGVSFIVGQAKRPDTSLEIKNSPSVDYGNPVLEATEGRKNNRAGMVDSSMGRMTSVQDTEQSNESTCVKTAVADQIGDSSHFDSEARKRVIVIGAGPAGLTAARHLQRQGFSVTVLEARSRIGGRVFTDRSSLSVPVDLGASIITGVEADVATERRPDPSSLVCAQLGLELTMLNSDCPLYDIVTRQKVPADMDEALEAEYNSLLDDTILLVAQKGEQAMRMSLEDGLEYALKRRRMARSGRSIEEIEQNNSADTPFASRRGSSGGRIFEEEILSPLERRVMDWHFANLEYGCAALLKEVSLPYWNQDDVYGGFGGAHCMIKGGYSTLVESLGEGLVIHLNHVVTNVSYGSREPGQSNKVEVSTTNGNVFFGDAVLITVPLGCLKAETIKFSPPLPQWKCSSIQRLGFGVLNKVVMEFSNVFWDDTVDYFGATAEETGRRGQCFMFWNVRKTVGAPVLIALVVGKAAIDGQSLRSCDHVNHALMVLRKLFGEASVPDPVAYVVTDWGRDPFSYGAYSYVAVGASGEDYDILGRPVDNCLFFAGEATCKEHPDTVGGAMMSGLQEAVRIINIFSTGNDYTAEVEAMEAAQRQSDTERDEVRDIMKRLEAIELSNVLYRNSLDGAQVLTRETLLRDMFLSAKTNAGRLHVAKKLLSLPVENLKSFAGNKKGLTTLNSWILDSMGKDGTQLLRHCVRLLVLVSTDLLAVRLSGIGKTVKEKVCVHTSRDIRAIASQLVSVWLEIFRKEKASNGGLKLSRQATAVDLSKRKSLKDFVSGKPRLSTNHGDLENKGGFLAPASAGSSSPSIENVKKLHGKPLREQVANDSRLEFSSSRSQGSISKVVTEKEDNQYAISEEEHAAIAAAEAARAKALAAAEAYASAEARRNTLLQLPKIPSFHKFARREQYSLNDEGDTRKKWFGGVLGRQDCISEIDSRNCRVRDWSVDFSAACVNLDNSRMSVDNLSQRSHSNEIASHFNFREHSGESVAVDSSIYTKAWIDTTGDVGIKDYHAIDRWQSQAAAAGSDFSNPTIHLKDEEDSNVCSRLPSWKRDGIANESSISQVTVNKEALKSHPRGADRIKQAVVDYVASLLMPLYKARKLNKDDYKAIMKKSATKVMEQATDAEKAMTVHEFLDFKRKNKIRSFVDTLIERHMTVKPNVK